MTWPNLVKQENKAKSMSAAFNLFRTLNVIKREELFLFEIALALKGNKEIKDRK